MEKYWIIRARELLALSRSPIPHELNELDWKSELSSKQDRTIEHLIAFANHPGGGYLVFGVRDGDAALIGVDQGQVTAIVNKLTNLGRDAVEPSLMIDHAVVEVDNVPLLFIHVPEQLHKPAHRRGKSIGKRGSVPAVQPARHPVRKLVAY